MPSISGIIKRVIAGTPGRPGEPGKAGEPGKDAPVPDMTPYEQRFKAMEDAAKLRKGLVPLPDVSIPASALVQATIGEKPFADRPCLGVKADDTLLLIPKTQPSGYWLVSYTVPGADKITLRCYCPILAIAGPTLVYSVLAIR